MKACLILLALLVTYALAPLPGRYPSGCRTDCGVSDPHATGYHGPGVARTGPLATMVPSCTEWTGDDGRLCQLARQSIDWVPVNRAGHEKCWYLGGDGYAMVACADGFTTIET